MNDDQQDRHLVDLPGTPWRVWRDAVLRTTGFPADGLELFTAPDLAATADAVGDDDDPDVFAEAYATAASGFSAQVEKLATDPLLREAVAWQNPTALQRFDDLLASGPPTNAKTRKRRVQREDLLIRYWQRYCSKNETVGFFGPVTWVGLDPAVEATEVEVGEQLTRWRGVFFEDWLLEAFGGHLAVDPVVRPHLPVTLLPHVSVVDGEARRPGEPAVAVAGVSADALPLCDGRSATAVASTLAGRATTDEVLAALLDLEQQGLVRWGFDLPYNPAGEPALEAGLAAIADDAARERAVGEFARLAELRQAVADAAGDSTALGTAMRDLAATFEELTGEDPERRDGQAYAGRLLCYEETVRDLDVRFGGSVLRALAGPLPVLLTAARWVGNAMSDRYQSAFSDLFERLAGDERRLPLGDFWGPATALLSGEDCPADEVALEFSRRWSELFGLTEVADDVAEVSATSAELGSQLDEIFPAQGPAWPGARIHSPDVQICASDVDAVGRGEFTLVLGEVHVSWPTLDCAVFADRHPDPARLLAAYDADIGQQFRPLYPRDYPRYTGRIAPVLGVHDHQLGFAAATGADPERLLPVSSLTVVEGDAELEVVAPDGRRWPLRQVFSLLVGWLGSEAFKLSRGGEHSPRVRVDDMVLSRETWRTTVGETGLARLLGAPERYLATRRWRASLGLPERVFVRIETEVKPVYVDFTSPSFVASFLQMLRSAHTSDGDDVRLTVSELLPRVEDAWVPDAEGRRYFSELRLQVLDPLPLRS